MTPPQYRYDVAISFLSKDLSLARELTNRLEPTLSVFIYDRHKEELLGADGMERFAKVFKDEARLGVILYRDGWGHTPWTAFEESHIRSRALLSRMTSFMLVALDKSEHPTWGPASHLYASIDVDSLDEIAAIIRARAREQGAVLKKDTAADFALRQIRAQERARKRENRAGAVSALPEVRAEVKRLFDEIGRLVGEIKTVDPSCDLEFGVSPNECGLARSHRSISVAWIEPVANSLKGAYLRVNHWESRITLPSAGRRSSGSNWRKADGYVPHLAESDEWEWRFEPQTTEQDDDDNSLIILPHHDNAISSSVLADHLVRLLFDE